MTADPFPTFTDARPYCQAHDRDGLRTARRYSIGRIVDRIGSGDAFGAGVLHGLETGLDDQATPDFGLVAA